MRTATRIMGEIERLKAAREQTENPLTRQELDHFYSQIGMCQKAVSESKCFIDKFNLQQRGFRLQYSQLAQKGQIDGQHNIGASGMSRILSPRDAGHDEEVSPFEREGQGESNVRESSPQETLPASSDIGPTNIEPGFNIDRMVDAVSNLKSAEYPTDHQASSRPPDRPFESSVAYRSVEKTRELQSPLAGRGMDPAIQQS
jgi:hypothetical protein